jgi:IS30 family transposase
MTQRRVRQKLVQEWSPEQIAGHFKRTGQVSISHQTIYKMIRLDRAAGGKLYTFTRHMMKQRRKGYGSKDYRGRLEGKRHISERPGEVEHRLVIGHWEGDTVMGRDRYHGVVTLVERATGFAIVKKISCRTAAEVAAMAGRAIARHHKRFKTLTLDNGTEFHNYRELEEHTGVVCYFATPYHSWERGTNENFNGLLRQYLKKRSSMKDLTQQRCDWIANRINCRPRKRLGYRSPKELYYATA